MKVMRPINWNDAASFEKFAFTVTIGVTSLPKNRETLKRKLTRAVESFGKEVTKPEKELYLFVLEDSETGQTIGTSGIWAKTGFNEGSYFYRVETYYHDNHALPLPVETRIMHPVCYTNGPAEIGSLFLLREYRSGGLGKLLSLSRFLFVAAFPNRFDETILSNMRGVIKPDGTAPFWEGFGRKFLDMPFSEVMKLLDRGDKSFIQAFIPKHPVYASLLPKETQEVIGQVHPNTMPALNLLTKEGFRDASFVDIFDGGPILTTQRDSIRTVAESQVIIVNKVDNINEKEEQFLISNEKLDFRACLGSVSLNDNGEATIATAVAKALNIEVGEKIRIGKR